MANTAFVLNGTVGLLSSRQMVAGSGSYFTVTEPTLGTGVAFATVTSSSATANGLFVVRNTNAVGGKNIYLDRLSLIETAAAPTGALTMRVEVVQETGLVVGTGAVATRTPVQINNGFPQTTGAVVQAFSAGAITIPAAVGTRTTIDDVAIPHGLNAIVHDNYIVDFGADGPSTSTIGLTAARTQASRIATQAAPVVVAPQNSVWLNMYWITQAANVPSFCYSLTYAEL